VPDRDAQGSAAFKTTRRRPESGRREQTPPWSRSDLRRRKEGARSSRKRARNGTGWWMGSGPAAPAHLPDGNTPREPCRAHCSATKGCFLPVTFTVDTSRPPVTYLSATGSLNAQRIATGAGNGKHEEGRPRGRNRPAVLGVRARKDRHRYRASGGERVSGEW